MLRTSPGSRLFRDEELPRFVSSELCRARKKYPHLIEIGGAKLRYRRSARMRLDFDFRGLWEREFYGWIEIDRERVGALEFYEYRGDLFLDDSTFFETMDAMSGFQSELATALIEAWEDVSTTLFSYGDIIDFRNVWTNPRTCPPGLWASAANALIARDCSDYSILILKAFPLEYQGKGSEDVDASLRRRQTAMIRHYSRLLGAASLPGRPEWLYRINKRLSSVIDAPILCGRASHNAC